MPVPSQIEEEIINALELKNNSVLYDLGCGDGRILLKAVQKHPNIQAIGIEIGFVPYLIAKFKTRNYKNVKIKREDIFKTDLNDATHIFLYLYPKVINHLITNIKSQCKLGTIIISCDFELENEKPNKVVNLQNVNPNSKRGRKLFIYTI